MKYTFIIYSILMVLTSIIPIFPKQSIHHMFFMDLAPSIQNLLHIPMFVFWVIFISRSRFNIEKFLVQKRTNIILIGCVFGILLEIIQIPIPGRYASLEDILLNIVGLGSGIFLSRNLNTSKGFF